jgi:hypothetical protein
MRRFSFFLSALVLAASLAGAARADAPTREDFSFSDSYVIPAGEQCEFPVRVSFTLDEFDLIFGDPDNPTMVIAHAAATVSHTNMETGYSLTEVDQTTSFFYPQDETGKVVGIIWKLRTPDGKLVFTQMGQIVFTFDGADIKRTPHMLPADVTSMYCSLLGGSAA